MNRRFFIGAPASSELKKEAANVQRALSGLGDLRWVSASNLHITLVPPWYGEDEESVFNKLSDLGRELVKARLKFNKLEPGPVVKASRLIWFSGEGSEEAERMKDKLEKEFGVLNTHKPWVPHITVVRFKKDERPALGSVDWPLKVDISMEIDRVVLYESHLKRNGAEYEVLREVYLR